jgi:hypothetical protein
MSLRFRAAALLALGTFVGCTCGSKQATPGDASSASAATASESGAVPQATSLTKFSAPIAAARGQGGAVLVAGLVIPSKAIVVTRIEADGRTAWAKEVLTNVAWISDADLRLYRSGDGGAIVWRGLRDGKRVRALAFFGADGAPRGEPIEVGAASCVTDQQLVWLERGADGKNLVRARKHAGGGTEDLLSVPKDREAMLVCAKRRVYSLGEGDEDITLSATQSDGGVWHVLGEQDYAGEDELREHLEYVDGDDLGVVRLTHSGAMYFRELRDANLSPWKKVSLGIPRDDDVVALEANATSVLAVHTRDDLEACDADLHGLTIHAVRFDRKSGEATALSIAPPACGKEQGPFWAGRAGEKMIVAWAERTLAKTPGAPAIVGLSYRVLEDGKLSELRHLARTADAMVEAGCDATGCVFVALAREPGQTDAEPSPVVALRVP